MIENESPQVAPWLFEIDLGPLLSEAGSLLLLCCFSAVAVGGPPLGELMSIGL
jgi:hypothetical protein